MISKNVDAWNIVFYNDVSLVNKLKFLGVEMYNYKKIGD